MSARWQRLGAAGRSLLRAVGRRGRLDAEMEEEMRFHIDNRAADLEREGVPAREAARRARVEFGGAATHKDAARRVLGVRWLDEVGADLRYAVRLLGKSPGFTVIAVGSLALAIGANTTVFSAANVLLYQHVHVPHAEQLQALLVYQGAHSALHYTASAATADGSDGFSYPVFRQLQSIPLGDATVFGFRNYGGVSARIGAETASLQATVVSGNFYRETQVQPVIGRPIEPQDDLLTAPDVVVLSYGLWQRLLGGAQDAIGKSVSVEGRPMTVIGVNPPGFTGVAGVTQHPDLILPLHWYAAMPSSDPKYSLTGPNYWWINAMIRVQPDAPLEMWKAQLGTAFKAAFHGTMPVAQGETVPRLFLQDGSHGSPIFRGILQRPVFVLLLFSGLVLLLACANIANLMLARATLRQREIAVRLALGAGRARVARQLLTESLLLGVLGGCFGLAVGYPFRNPLGQVLNPFGPKPWEADVLQVPFNWQVFCFAGVVTLLTVLLFGLVPALRPMKVEASTIMKDTTHLATRRRRAWGGRGIVTLQIALSVVLVFSAFMFARTLIRLTSADLGFRPENLVLFSINLPAKRYPPPKDVLLYQRLEETFAAVPGVASLSGTDISFLSGNTNNRFPRLEGEPKRKDNDTDFSRLTDIASVGPDFLRTMEIPLLRGRNIAESDTATSPRIVIVNELFARKFFPQMDPLGRRFTADEDDKGNPIWLQIVGICADTAFDSLQNNRAPIVLTPYRQQKQVDGMTYVLRSREPLDRLLPGLKRAVQTVDSDLPLINLRTQQQQIDAGMQQERTFAGLTASFGLLALLLACVGVYGVMAYTVSQRTGEIGIRLALGAGRGQVRGMVLRETAWLAGVGVVAGLGAALGLGRLVGSMLYGVKATDGVSFAAAAGLLLVVAMVAGWVPAARAARIDPMQALRHE